MNIVKKITGLWIIILLSSTSWAMEDSKENWITSNDNWATPDLHILSMAEWNEKELEYAISDEGFFRLEKLLLEKRGQVRIKNLEPLMVDSQDFLAAFFAYYMVDTSTCLDGAGGGVAWNAIRAAGSHVRSNFWNAARESASKDAWNAAMDARNAASDAVRETLAILKLEPSGRFDTAGRRLSILYEYAYGSQDEYFDNYFKRAFLAAKIAFHPGNFPEPANKILDTIAAYTWHNKADLALAENRYIVVLKRIFERLADVASQKKMIDPTISK